MIEKGGSSRAALFISHPPFFRPGRESGCTRKDDLYAPHFPPLAACLALLGCADTPAPDEGASDSVQAQTSDAIASPPETVNAEFVCEGGPPMAVTFDNAANTATVRIREETFLLEGQPAGSGIWYAGEDRVLRGKGGDVTWTNGETMIACEAISGPAAPEN